jgi:anaerobic selenocysteine-containing dehydrogenase
MSEQTFVNCTGGGPIRVHVEDGKITKVRPLVFDETDAPSWTIDVEGQKYTPYRKACVAPFSLVERARVYSDERILYPMKRVDFDPNGERNPQNRGKSGYERISWDEALDLVAGEMKRIRSEYGSDHVPSLLAPQLGEPRLPFLVLGPLLQHDRVHRYPRQPG